MRISVTGVDGTGKTTLVRALQREFARAPDLVRAFRAPQYHEDPDAPFARLSARLDELGAHADRLGDPLLKTSALFLSMTLYGDVEEHYARAYRPGFLFSERQALADSLAYSRFYKGLLTGPVRREALAGQDVAPVEEWIEVLRGRLPERTRGLTLEGLPLFIRELFELGPEPLVESLRALYHCELPDAVILLKVSPKRLMERMAEKARGGIQREMHERQHVLEALQGALEQGCGVLAGMKPGMRVEVLDTGELSEAESLGRLVELAGVRRGR
jgi:thymidylate kinase